MQGGRSEGVELEAGGDDREKKRGREQEFKDTSVTSNKRKEETTSVDAFLNGAQHFAPHSRKRQRL